MSVGVPPHVEEPLPAWPPLPFAVDAAACPYEEQRQRNIEANERVLEELGLSGKMEAKPQAQRRARQRTEPPDGPPRISARPTKGKEPVRLELELPVYKRQRADDGPEVTKKPAKSSPAKRRW